MRSPRWGCCAIVLASFLPGCTAGGSDTSDDAVSTPSTSVVQATGTAATVPETVAPATTAPTVPPEPTGVPGLDAADPFCAAWAEYGGSVQAISVADAFGELDSAEVAALEVIAAGTVTAAVAAIESHWPVEAAVEEAVVIDGLLGPFARRADKAVEAARRAGLGIAELGELRAAWATALRNRRPDEPVITVPSLPAAVAAAVLDAASAFDAAATPFADDPSLRVDDIEAPVTYRYLAEHCPDLAASGVGDAL